MNVTKCMMGEINANRPVFYECNGTSLQKQLFDSLGNSSGKNHTHGASFSVYTCSGISFYHFTNQCLHCILPSFYLDISAYCHNLNYSLGKFSKLQIDDHFLIFFSPENRY